MIFETLRGTLSRYPSTLLGNETDRLKFYIAFKNCYFFDRHRECFQAILYYYQSGEYLLLGYNFCEDFASGENWISRG